MNLVQLLALVWPPPESPAPDLAPAEWQAIGQSARQHRLRPLLDFRSREHGWTVPADLAEEWREAYRRAERRALHQKVQLARITRWLDEAGIEAIVLKGGALAWRGWFNPALRPMRDLDILVPEDRALEAQALLVAKGYKGSVPTTLGDAKHLPGLSDPETGVLVEIHTGLIETATPQWAESNRLFLESAKAHRQAGHDSLMPIFADSDTLLHVIAHAVLDHQFNNGPLFLLDLDALLAHGDIDWPRFWETARQTNLTRAAQLALALGEGLLPAAKIDWQGQQPAGLNDETIASAASLMLVTMEQRTELGFLGRALRFRWRDQPTILLKALGRLRTGVRAEPLHAQPAPGIGRRIANFSSRPGRVHVRRSLDVAKWLRNAPGPDGCDG